MRKKIGFPARKKADARKIPRPPRCVASLIRRCGSILRPVGRSGRLRLRRFSLPRVDDFFQKHCPQGRVGKTSSFRPVRAMPSSPSPVNAFQTVRHVVAVSGGRNDHFDRSATLIARSTHRPLRSVVLSRLQLSVSVERKICLYFDIITVIDSLSIVTKKANGKNISVTANAYTDTQKPTAQSAVGC